MLAACILLGSRPSVSAVGTCATPSTQADSGRGALRDLVDEMNTQGLADFRNLPVGGGGYQAVALSPVLRWQTRFLVALGTDHPPSSELQTQARAFVGQFSSAIGRNVNSHIWVNDESVSYGENAMASMISALCVATTRLHWSIGSDKDAPVDALMREWLRVQHVTQPEQLGRTADQIVYAMNMARVTYDRSAHPFNALTTLSQEATFDVSLPVGTKRRVTLPYYDVDGVHGFRLDSKGSSITLYLLYGKERAIEKLQKTMDLAHWAAITKRFVRSIVHPPRLPLILHESFGFYPSAEYAFGLSLITPIPWGAGIEEMGLSVHGKHLDLTAVSGVEGHIGNHFRFRIIPAHLRVARMQPAQDIVVVLVDRNTGAIILVGAGVATVP